MRMSLHEGIVRQLAEFGEGSVHLSTSTFEEFTATSDEQCVASEHTTRGAFIRGICCIIANRVLGVARSRDTSAKCM